MSSALIPDLLAQARLSRAVNDLKTRAATAREETVTGRYQDLAKASGGDLGGLQLLRKAIDDSSSYQKTLALAETRASQTQTALQGLTLDSRRIAVNALSFLGRGDEAALKTSADDARATLYTMFSSLSAAVGGRALFSGDAVDQPALGDVEDLLDDVAAMIAGAADADAADAALDLYFNDPAGGFETSIYAGGDGQAPTVEIAPGVRVQSAVKANAQPIKDMIRAMAVIASYETLPSGSREERDKIAESAMNLSIDAEGRIVSLRAAVGVGESRISASKARYASEEMVLTNLYNNKTLRDPYEAATALTLLETQLEASYLMTARLSNLSLANFLR